MKQSPYSSTSSQPSTLNTPSVLRKPSFLKSLSKAKGYAVELPRFYSSDEKKSKKSLFSQEKHAESDKREDNTKNRADLKNRPSFKYAKTEKNQTPTKFQSSTKTIKVNQQRWNQIIQRGGESRRELGKVKSNKKKPMIEQTEGMEWHYGSERESNKVSSNANLNKIKYKIGQHKKERSLHGKESSMPMGVDTEPLEREDKVVSLKDDKVNTEMPESIQISISKRGHTFKQYLEETKHLGAKEESVKIKQRQRLGEQEISYLQLMIEVLKKSLKMVDNLDFPETYIVSEKSKSEKGIYSGLQPKYQKLFKTHIILSRLTFYLYAHFILTNMNSKNVLGVLSKLLDSQQIIAGILGVNLERSQEKKYSHSKMTVQRDQSQQRVAGLIVENRGANIGRNNQIVKKMLEDILSKAKIPYAELFQSLLISASKIDSFEFIAFIDKTLKWEVLKIPSYPFLPPCVTNHSHYLILDLDQTLIHFDADKQVFHVRPYAEQFLKSLSSYYQITIFTAGTKEYADEIINQIDKGGFVKHRLYRNHLTFFGGQSVKDLTMLGRDMSSTIIIDNLEANFRMHAQNGILIKSWFGEESDKSLSKLEGLLKKIAVEFGSDLRKGIKIYQEYIEREISDKSLGVRIKYKI